MRELLLVPDRLPFAVMLKHSPHRIEHARDLLTVLVLKEFRVRYKRTVLGYAWSVLQPLAFAVVYYLVFRRFIRVDTGEVGYTLFLVLGLFPWQWFNNAVAGGANALVVNATLIKQVSFPRVYAVISGLLNELLHFVLTLPIMLLFLFGSGGRPRLAWLWQLPLLLLVQALLTLGLALLAAAGNLVLRDLERLIGIGLLMLFYLTPVVYPPDLIPQDLKWILYANPMGCLVVLWRDVMINASVDLWILGLAVAWAVSAVAAGVVVFRRLEPRFAELI